MRALWVLIITCSCLMLAAAQQKPAMTPSAKLALARSAYLQRAGASDVAWNVITSNIEDWGRYTLVDAPEKADIVIELSQSAEGGMSIQSSTSTTTPTASTP